VFGTCAGVVDSRAFSTAISAVWVSITNAAPPIPAVKPKDRYDTYGLRMCGLLHPNDNGRYARWRVSVGLRVGCGMRVAMKGVVARVRSCTELSVEMVHRHAARTMSVPRDNARSNRLRLRCGSATCTANGHHARSCVGTSQLYWRPAGISSLFGPIDTYSSQTMRAQHILTLSTLAPLEGKCGFEHIHYRIPEYGRLDSQTLRWTLPGNFATTRSCLDRFEASLTERARR
jgi:hypothetical protein